MRRKKPDKDRTPDFDGKTYKRNLDHVRLRGALRRIWELMRDGKKRTLEEVANRARCSESGAGARLRDLRKEQFSCIYPTTEMLTTRDKNIAGLWLYQVIVPAKWRAKR